MGTGPHGFRGTLRQAEEKRGKAKEAAGVIHQESEPSRHATGLTKGGRGVSCSHPGYLSLPRENPKVARSTPGDPQGFRGMLRLAEEKSGEAKVAAGVVQWTTVPSRHAPGPTQGGRGISGFHPSCLSLIGGHPKAARSPQGRVQASRVSRGTLRQAEEKSSEAEEAARVIQRRPVPSWPAPGPRLGVHGVAGSHPRCLSLIRGAC